MRKTSEEASKRAVKKQRELDVMEFIQQKSKEVDLSDKVRKNRTVTTTVGREKLFLDQFEESLRKVFKEKLSSLPKLHVKKFKGKTKRILNVMFSDTHYGSCLDPREVQNHYGPVEEARRTAAVCRTVAEYKKDHRAETELHVHLLGDMIQGQLHDMRDGAPLAEQVAAAMSILIQSIRFFATQFPSVVVRATPGNHGRNTARHHDRATNQKWDAIEMHIYYAIKLACESIPNVKVLLNYEPKYDFGSFDNVGMATHGDTVMNPGYPGKSVDVASLKKQAESINNVRVSKGEKPYGLFIMGHVHVGSMVHLPGGIIVMTNGCLLPPDSYAQSIGIFGSACGQWIWESTPEHIVGDARFVTVGEDNDKDKSLDSIIKPFLGL